MSLKIRRLKLLVRTLNGDYGADLEFPDGLVLLHVHNSRGKSTVLKSIVYGLGLERMFGPVSQPPLTPAMTTALKDGPDEWPVIESWVFLEIENHVKRAVTIRRKVVGEDLQDWRLMDVWEGRLANEETMRSVPAHYYVRDAGSAQLEQGFYTFLAKFIGWDLPEVVKYDGSPCPLYIECILPLFFVEQTQGWTSIQATTPRFFQIKQPNRKAIEYLMRFEALDRDVKRQKLEQEEAELRHKWTSQRRALDLAARNINGVLRNFPEDPLQQWPPATLPSIEVYQAKTAISLPVALLEDQELLGKLNLEDIPTAEQAASDVGALLQEANEKLLESETLTTETYDDFELEQSNLKSVQTRLQAVTEDLEHNLGTKKLRDLGVTKTLALAAGECPTCHQSIQDSLLGQEGKQPIMTLDENIAYVQAQKKTLERLASRSSGAIAALERRLVALSKYSNEIRTTIRSLKRTLTSAGTAPSEAAIRERLIVEQRLNERALASKQVDSVLSALRPLVAEWKGIQDRKAALKDEKLSASDEAKLLKLNDLFCDMVAKFGFSSFDAKKLSVSNETYLPRRERFDLIYDVSASDNVRVITAYLTALLELARQPQTNHPGLLILDEPRQQNVKWSDLATILERLAQANNHGQQVIVATSDEPARIEHLKVKYHRVDVDFDARLLQKLPSSS